MSLTIYNLSLLFGMLLVAIGIGMWSVPAGIAIGGALLIAVTLINALIVAPRLGKR